MNESYTFLDNTDISTLTPRQIINNKNLLELKSPPMLLTASISFIYLSLPKN